MTVRASKCHGRLYVFVTTAATVPRLIALTALSVLDKPIARALAHAAAAEDAVVKATVALETDSVQPAVRPGHRYNASP